MWPGYKNAYFPGSASANYFYSVYGVFGSSFLDSLHAADRISGEYIPGKCLSVPGCYTFFAQQGSTHADVDECGGSGLPWSDVSVRRRFSNGLQFDFNYTLAHSIDNGSAAESGAGEQGAAIQDIYNLSAFRGSSDFDIRNNFNANFMYALPVGKGKSLLKTAPGWLDQIVGGWQISSIWRYSTPLPSAVEGDLAYNTNYWLSSLAVVNTPTSSGASTSIRMACPSIFTNTSMSNNFQDQPPEGAGTRAAVRLAPIFNVDMSVSKSFKLPKEGQRGGIQGGGVQCLQPSQLHQPEFEPGVSADLWGVSGDYAPTLNAVRATLRVLTVSAEGRRRKAIACPTSRLMVVVMMVV